MRIADKEFLKSLEESGELKKYGVAGRSGRKPGFGGDNQKYTHTYAFWGHKRFGDANEEAAKAGLKYRGSEEASPEFASMYSHDRYSGPKGLKVTIHNHDGGQNVSITGTKAQHENLASEMRLSEERFGAEGTPFGQEISAEEEMRGHSWKGELNPDLSKEHEED